MERQVAKHVLIPSWYFCCFISRVAGHHCRTAVGTTDQAGCPR
jgi:hypothetical protein